MKREKRRSNKLKISNLLLIGLGGVIAYQMVRSGNRENAPIHRSGDALYVGYLPPVVEPRSRAVLEVIDLKVEQPGRVAW